MAYNFADGGDDNQVFLMPPDPRDLAAGGAPGVGDAAGGR